MNRPLGPPRYAVSSSLYCWMMVPIAPSRIMMRRARISRSWASVLDMTGRDTLLFICYFLWSWTSAPGVVGGLKLYGITELASADCRGAATICQICLFFQHAALRHTTIRWRYSAQFACNMVS